MPTRPPPVRFLSGSRSIVEPDWHRSSAAVGPLQKRSPTRLTGSRSPIEGRKLLIERIAVIGLTAAAEAAGVSLRTARKWLERFRLGGVAVLADRSSHPSRVRSSLDDMVLHSIERLRRLRMPMRRIAELVGRSVSTVSRVLDRLGRSSLKALDPVRPIVRYERTRWRPWRLPEIWNAS